MTDAEIAAGAKPPKGAAIRPPLQTADEAAAGGGNGLFGDAGGQADLRHTNWQTMDSAPRTGQVIILTDDLDSETGRRAMWYKALGAARPWVKAPEGWLCPESRVWIDFTPLGWGHEQKPAI